MEGLSSSTYERAEIKRIQAILLARLTQAIRASGLSRRALADLVGVHLNTVHAYASGSRFPRLSQATLLARALGVSLDWLLDVRGVARLEDEFVLTSRDREILEYVEVENGRSHFPNTVSVSHAFGADPYWASSYVRRLLRLGLLAYPPGLRLTKSGLSKIPPDQRLPTPRRKVIRRTPAPKLRPQIRTPLRFRSSMSQILGTGHLLRT
jgi:transcriptional regulator with XRE-family HTH domain